MYINNVRYVMLYAITRTCCLAVFLPKSKELQIFSRQSSEKVRMYIFSNKIKVCKLVTILNLLLKKSNVQKNLLIIIFYMASSNIFPLLYANRYGLLIVVSLCNMLLLCRAFPSDHMPYQDKKLY